MTDYKDILAALRSTGFAVWEVEKGPDGRYRPKIDLTYVRHFPHHCSAAVSRSGEEEACGKPAVAVRHWAGTDEFEAEVYPVCVAHCRVGQMVPLQELLWWGNRE